MARSLFAAILSTALMLSAVPPAVAAEYLVKPIIVPVLKSVFGQVRSRNLVPARARIGGTLVSISVQEGDHVEASQVIAKVVDDKLVLQLNALDASQLAVTAQLENARTNLERAQQLFSRGTIAKSRLDDLQTQSDVLTNELRAIDARKSVIVQQQNEGDVFAPSAGRVLAVPVTEGSVILPGEAIARIAGGGYFLRLSLPERHAGGINTGDQVKVGTRGLSPSQSQQSDQIGRVVKIYPEIENGRVIADVEVATLGDFFVGERFLVIVPIGARSTLAVPDSAITNRHGIDYVTITHRGTTTEISVIPAEAFDTEDGSWTEILTGLQPGDTVIVP